MKTSIYCEGSVEQTDKIVKKAIKIGWTGSRYLGQNYGRVFFRGNSSKYGDYSGTYYFTGIKGLLRGEEGLEFNLETEFNNAVEALKENI